LRDRRHEQQALRHPEGQRQQQHVKAAHPHGGIAEAHAALVGRLLDGFHLQCSSLRRIAASRA
jgi:hypothetical protein